MTWLLDTLPFMARAHCGQWERWEIDLSVSAAAVFAVAYLLLPLSIMVFWFHKRHSLPYSWVLPLFAAFILLCALHHAVDATMFLWPAYRLKIVVDCIGAALSIVTALVTPWAVDYLIRYPGPKELRGASKALAETITDTVR